MDLTNPDERSPYIERMFIDDLGRPAPLDSRIQYRSREAVEPIHLWAPGWFAKEYVYGLVGTWIHLGRKYSATVQMPVDGITAERLDNHPGDSDGKHIIGMLRAEFKHQVRRSNCPPIDRETFREEWFLVDDRREQPERILLDPWKFT